MTYRVVTDRTIYAGPSYAIASTLAEHHVELHEHVTFLADGVVAWEVVPGDGARGERGMRRPTAAPDYDDYDREDDARRLDAARNDLEQDALLADGTADDHMREVAEWLCAELPNADDHVAPLWPAWLGRFRPRPNAKG